MRDAVNFDAELRCRAIEIDYVWAGRMLVPELQPGGARAEDLPEPGFGWRHDAAQGARFPYGGSCGLPHLAPPPCFAWSPSPSPAATGRIIWPSRSAPLSPRHIR